MWLSIIIPVYNTQAYLERCVDSVLANDCTNSEIVLVDDGSTDGVCPALCDRLAGEHPDLIRVIHQENRGLGGARNTGLEAAQGAYLLFLDSDDTITPDALTKLRTTIERTQADVIAFNFFSEDGSGRLTPGSANYLQADIAFSAGTRPEFLLSLPSATCRAWKRSLFLASGIRYPERVWYEDLRTSVKLFVLASSIVTLPDCLYRYLQRPGSIMRSSQVQRNREIIDAFDDVLAWFRDRGLFRQYQDVLCRLCIDHLYLAASVRVLQANHRHSLLQDLAEYLAMQFPDYRNNPYLDQMPRAKKLVFWLLERRRFRTLRFLFQIKNHPEHLSL